MRRLSGLYCTHMGFFNPLNNYHNCFRSVCRLRTRKVCEHQVWPLTGKRTECFFKGRLAAAAGAEAIDVVGPLTDYAQYNRNFRRKIGGGDVKAPLYCQPFLPCHALPRPRDT